MNGNGRHHAGIPAAPHPLRTSLAYGLMIAATIAIFYFIRGYGENLTAPAAPANAERSAAIKDGGHIVFHVLLALAAVVATGVLLGRLFAYLGQPPVIGEVIGGIILGPSLLGMVAPGVKDYVLPDLVAPSLSIIAQIGIILYMFLVGLELNGASLRGRAHAAIAISHAGIIVPFSLGAMLALFLYPKLSSSNVPFTSFALFLGVAMSITAFPVLARILSDRRMTKTPVGIVAVSCAATDDVTAWCLLAFVVGVVQAKMDGAIMSVALTIAYIGFMFAVVRPLATRWLARMDDGRLTRGIVGLVFVALLLSAVATEYIGIHAIFGAFMLGAVIPHDSAVARFFIHRLQDLVTVLLLPAFFAFTGMRTSIGLVSGVENWLICGLIILVATIGKFGGTYVAARLTGLAKPESTALGLLMNTRGLMELIVLNIGLDLQVISPTLFAMMVIMALATTLATSPLLLLIKPYLDLRSADESEHRVVEVAAPARTAVV